MIEQIAVSTKDKECATDITRTVAAIVEKSGVDEGLCVVYSPHTTCGVLINENYDPNVMVDIHASLKETVPKGKWLHDAVDGNADAHIKVALIGASEAIPVQKGRLMLGTWQSITVMEFDGPRSRKIVVRVT